MTPGTIVACLLLAAIPSSASAGTEPLTVEQVLKRVDQANHELVTWAANFQQRRHYVHFDQTESRSGRIAFQRGKGLRLDITEPDAEVVIVDRKGALQWRPKTRQLHIYHLERGTLRGEDFPIPIPLGDDGWDPRTDHEVKLVDSPGPEVVLELIPRSDSSTYQRKTIWFDPNTWLPVKLQLVETTDDVVQFSFTDIERNQDLPPGLFHFDRPKGAEVVEHTDLPRLDP